jgi:hypothetical protein
MEPLPLAVRDPVRGRLEAQHDDAHEELERLSAPDVADLTTLRAKHRLCKIRRLMAS